MPSTVQSLLPAIAPPAPTDRRSELVLARLRHSRRRLIAIGTIAAAGVLPTLTSLAAFADVGPGQSAIAAVQSFAAPAALTEAPVARDGFGITSYTVVQWPVPSTTIMTDGFGPRSCAGCSTFHKGIDLTPGVGFPVQAIADGVVTEVGNPSGELGVHVLVQHVIDGVTFTSLYGHMQLGSMNLAVGDVVVRGQQLGTVGDTGQSTGPHLHFGILSNGVEIDPQAWLLQHANI